MQNSESTHGPQRPAPIIPPPERIEPPQPRILTDCAEAYGQSSRRDAAVEWIIVHYTGVANVGARQIARNMAKKGAKTSVHYVVDPTGCYKLAPESKATWHVGNGKPNALYVGCTHAERWHKTIDPHGEFLGNRNSIGIELCVRKTDPHSKSVGDLDWRFEPQTLEHAAQLIADICLRLRIPVNHVARHYDCTGKPCMPLDTELLTPGGWAALSAIRIGDPVMCVRPDDLSGDFLPVLGITEPHIDTVITSRGVSLTANHRVWSRPSCVNGTWKQREWGNIVLGGNKMHELPAACNFGEGLPLTDDQLRLLVWTQGDGHFYKRDGIEFHLKKARKIERILYVLHALGYDPMQHWCKNGSVHIRLRNPGLREFIEEWLQQKQFSFKLLGLTRRQFDVFWDEILSVDGCRAGDIYTSYSKQSLDVVSALLATHGVRQYMTHIGHSKHRFDAVGTVASRFTVSSSSVTSSTREVVSCVEVPTGYILIRQHGRVCVVGNCPRPFVTMTQDGSDRSRDEAWRAFVRRIAELIRRAGGEP